ncbi:hypothetical protein BLNAU_22556 [Blattamonas nauphoetae]|uniref:Uncharacterized protein n=1 Tax=Blattamonas nauphoetae TaxID=2049346 RepID=A0ABQ9WT73_9EUKA|nr:hypothetical protein BLNAU_22556 [Blattamonas nauphoetae]
MPNLIAHFESLHRPSLGRSLLRQHAQKHSVFRHSWPDFGWACLRHFVEVTPKSKPNPSTPFLQSGILIHNNSSAEISMSDNCGMSESITKRREGWLNSDSQRVGSVVSSLVLVSVPFPSASLNPFLTSPITLHVGLLSLQQTITSMHDPQNGNGAVCVEQSQSVSTA